MCSKMMKTIIAALLCATIAGAVAACANSGTATSTEPSSAPDGGAVKVSVTFDAMKEFAKAVGGDKAQISVIVPNGTEPHDFEPKGRDLAALGEAQILVYNGLGMESWVEEAIAAAGNPSLIAVEATKGIDPIASAGPEATKQHGHYDPHAWLSLKNAETAARNILDALTQADPPNKRYYEQNCDGFIAQLEALYDKYHAKFQSAAKNSFVTGHAAFGYLCRDFALEQNSVEGTYAEGEPTARQLAALVEYCKQNHVTTIFAEKLASPAVSQTLANEVGAKVETIYTIESAEDGMTYLERMESNLAKIYESLGG